MEQVYWVIPDALAGRCGPMLLEWDCEKLYDGGIRGIVSLNGPVDTAPIEAAGIEHLPLYLPMINLRTTYHQRQFLQSLPEFFEFTDRMRAEKKPVLVHCYFGCDRTGAFLSCYLIAREGCDADTAIERVRKQQPRAMTAPGYESAVYLYAQQSPKSPDSSGY